jgi:hypothetical protein
MDIRFEFTLYLPFLLPRDSKNWGSEGVRYRQRDLEIAILVLPQSEAQNAPTGPEDLTVTRVLPGPQEEIISWQIMTTPHKYFYEVIIVAVFGSIANPEDVFKPIVRTRFLNAAIEAARRFLTFSRALARDTLIYFTGQEVTTEHLHFVGFPHCQSWWDLESGTRLGDDAINSCLGEVVGGRSGIQPVSWEIAIGRAIVGPTAGAYPRLVGCRDSFG